MRIAKFCVGSMLFFTGFSYGQPKEAGVRVERGKEPPDRGHAILMASPSFIPDSLKELYDGSALIIEGSIERKLPSRQFRPHTHLETDVVVSVSQVLKGDSSVKRIMVAELGGVLGPLRHDLDKDEPMQPGERYVLFLIPDKRAGLPNIDGLSHFAVVSSWIGKARVIGDTITMSHASPRSIKNVYDGISLHAFVTEVQALRSR